MDDLVISAAIEAEIHAEILNETVKGFPRKPQGNPNENPTREMRRVLHILTEGISLRENGQRAPARHYGTRAYEKASYVRIDVGEPFDCPQRNMAYTLRIEISKHSDSFRRSRRRRLLLERLRGPEPVGQRDDDILVISL